MKRFYIEEVRINIRPFTYHLLLTVENKYKRANQEFKNYIKRYPGKELMLTCATDENCYSIASYGKINHLF